MTSMVPASVRVRREEASASSRAVLGPGAKGRPTVGPGFGLAPALFTSRSVLPPSPADYLALSWSMLLGSQDCGHLVSLWPSYCHYAAIQFSYCIYGPQSHGPCAVGSPWLAPCFPPEGQRSAALGADKRGVSSLPDSCLGCMMNMLSNVFSASESLYCAGSLALSVYLAA